MQITLLLQPISLRALYPASSHNKLETGPNKMDNCSCDWYNMDVRLLKIDHREILYLKKNKIIKKKLLHKIRGLFSHVFL